MHVHKSVLLRTVSGKEKPTERIKRSLISMHKTPFIRLFLFVINRLKKDY